jgi:hypothetical protein
MWTEIIEHVEGQKTFIAKLQFTNISPVRLIGFDISYSIDEIFSGKRKPTFDFLDGYPGI